jgi:hypothetical protein
MAAAAGVGILFTLFRVLSCEGGFGFPGKTKEMGDVKREVTEKMGQNHR